MYIYNLSTSFSPHFLVFILFLFQLFFSTMGKSCHSLNVIRHFIFSINILKIQFSMLDKPKSTTHSLGKDKFSIFPQNQIKTWPINQTSIFIVSIIIFYWLLIALVNVWQHEWWMNVKSLYNKFTCIWLHGSHKW